MSQKESFPHLIHLNRKPDSRGFFSELLKSSSQESTEQFQLNHSRSFKGALRGLHFTNRPSSKRIFCIRGSIQGVVINLSREQGQFGQISYYQLDDENSELFYVPQNYAHGFQVISDLADIIYFTDKVYSGSDDFAINALDSDLDLNWNLTNLIRSERDVNAMSWHDYLKTRDLFG